MNYLRFLLEQVRDEEGVESSFLERLLVPIEMEVQELARRVKDAEPARGEDDTVYQSIVDDAADHVEDLLGVAFVISQTHVTQVVSRAMRVLRFAEGARKALPGITSKKEALTGACSKKVGTTSYTEIQVIDAFANYFKHHEEWVGDWSKLIGLSRRTADIITAVGATQGSTGNFRKGAAAIGNADLERVTLVIGIIARWRSDLAAQLEAEATKVGLI